MRGEETFYRELKKAAALPLQIQKVVALPMDVVIALSTCKKCRRFVCDHG